MALKDKVVEHQTENPTLVATVVVEENDTDWVVECEGRCGRRIGSPKHYYQPTDYNLGLDSPLIQVDMTAPAARRCALCGPFPTTA